MVEFNVKSRSSTDTITVQLLTPGEKPDPKADLVLEETKAGSLTNLKVAKTDTALLHFVAKHPAATDWNISIVNEPAAKPATEPAAAVGTEASFKSLAGLFQARETLLTQQPPASQAQLDAFSKAYKAAAATYIKQHHTLAPSVALDAFNAKLTSAFKATDGADASINAHSLQESLDNYRHDLV